MSVYFCASRRRRDEVRNVDFLNGIDFLEVSPADQRILLVHFIHPVSGLTRENFVIVGGVRVHDVRVDAVVGAAAEVVTLRADRPGDFSTYTLQLVTSAAVSDPPPGFDPMLSAVPFSFKVNCPGDFDCRPEAECELPELPAPHINYLAKDYASFRKLIFDRLAVTMPAWRERNPADLGVTLVELLAYAGDQLSYYQDAVATEAYIGTARRRTSVRRHARLVDYAMHDGASARAWLVFETDTDRGSAIAPAVPKGTAVAAPATDTQAALIFETLHDVPELRVSRNAVPFYTWSDAQCCLSKGATRATLEGSAATLGLAKGDVLLFEEVLGATSGLEADADRTHRHVVRLAEDPLERQDPLTSITVLDIRWHDEDAMPFALCLTEFPGKKRAGVARANVALSDHGQTFVSSQPGAALTPADAGVGPYRPVLNATGLAFVTPFDEAQARSVSAAAAVRLNPRETYPALLLRADGERWRPQRDLLNSHRFAPEFVVETEPEGTGQVRAHLRFGDGVQGRRPQRGTQFSAEYRLGGGASGNIGADALTELRLDLDPQAVKVRNPLPAMGGADPEPARDVAMHAPQAFRTQARAVTAADYAAAAAQHPDVQRAACTRRWTGLFHTMFITVDRRDGKPVTAEFEAELRSFLDRFRMAGYDLEVDGPRYVALDLTLEVCVMAGYQRSHVKQALLEAFGRGEVEGRRGFFHPDHYTFGQPVFMSQVVASAMQVPGVQSVTVPPGGFRRFGLDPHGEREAGMLPIHRLEIARVDNDPSVPENGRVTFVMKGGA
jgi:hypothetical protein